VDYRSDGFLIWNRSTSKERKKEKVQYGLSCIFHKELTNALEGTSDLRFVGKVFQIL
jgi:hypothetical protein